MGGVSTVSIALTSDHPDFRKTKHEDFCDRLFIIFHITHLPLESQVSSVDIISVADSTGLTVIVSTIIQLSVRSHEVDSASVSIGNNDVGIEQTGILIALLVIASRNISRKRTIAAYCTICECPVILFDRNS